MGRVVSAPGCGVPPATPSSPARPPFTGTPISRHDPTRVLHSYSSPRTWFSWILQRKEGERETPTAAPMCTDQGHTHSSVCLACTGPSPCAGRALIAGASQAGGRLVGISASAAPFLGNSHTVSPGRPIHRFHYDAASKLTALTKLEAKRAAGTSHKIIH